MSNLTELLSQKTELDKQLSSIQTELKDLALANVVSIMKEAGLSVADVTKALTKTRVTRSGTKRQGKQYTDGTNTWNGLGRRPAWVNEAEAAGNLKPVEANA